MNLKITKNFNKKNILFIEAGAKAQSIVSHFRNHGLQVPTYGQINNHIQRNYVKSILGDEHMSIEAIIKWVEHHQQDPDDLDKVFVAGFDYKTKPTITFRVFLTTKRLLQFIPILKHLLADATYKLLVEGIPVLTYGVTDQTKKIHLLGLVISTNETI